MTNLELQAIGIDADKWTAATDKQRIEWGKANTTSGLGLHDKAFEWLESQPQNVIYYCLSSWTKAVDKGTIQRDSYCYRLRPDYEEPARWWFHPCGIEYMQLDPQIVQSVERPDHSPHWLEVTPEYAAYLSAKPDGDCELREVVVGDVYYDYAGKKWMQCFMPLLKKYGMTTHRWCKVKPAVDVDALIAERDKAFNAMQTAVNELYRLSNAIESARKAGAK